MDKAPIEVAAISYEVTVTKSGKPSTKPATDPKTVFERAGDLDRFEAHALPYMSAKVRVLRNRVPPPPRSPARLSASTFR